ncbi:MAG: hypothetical protein KBT31_00605, partial [Firmicutes bacterium]|nr:hypothetical protein [Candidatus Colimorpha enterica]
MNYEKVSVNIDDKKLAQIDMLVENDFYANRSDFINQAVSRQLDTEAETISGILNQKSLDSMIVTDSFWFIGIQSISRDYLTRVKELGTKINVKGFGILFFDNDCDEQLVKDTVASVSKKIRINASAHIKESFNGKD